MVGVDKNKLGDILKKALDPKAEEVKKTVTPLNPTKSTSTPKITYAKGTQEEARASLSSQEKANAIKNANVAETSKKQEEILKSKTHQDLINAAYKAAEKLGIAPWVLLRAAEWGDFTNDRGKKYTGPIIDDIKGLDDAQKKALKEALGL